MSGKGKKEPPVGEAVPETGAQTGVGQTGSQDVQDSGLECGGVLVDVSLAVTGFNAFVYGASPGEMRVKYISQRGRT